MNDWNLLPRDLLRRTLKVCTSRTTYELTSFCDMTHPMKRGIACAYHLVNLVGNGAVELESLHADALRSVSYTHLTLPTTPYV